MTSQPAVLPGTAITIPCYRYNERMAPSNTTRISPVRFLPTDNLQIFPFNSNHRHYSKHSFNEINYKVLQKHRTFLSHDTRAAKSYCLKYATAPNNVRIVRAKCEASFFTHFLQFSIILQFLSILLTSLFSNTPIIIYFTVRVCDEFQN